MTGACQNVFQEPTASGLAALTPEGATELEAFLGCKLNELPNVTPNMHAEARDYTTWTPADRILDLLEGMWSAQALKERHFDSWISDLRNMHIEQVRPDLLTYHSIYLRS